MNTIFYVGFFMVNFWLSTVYMNYIKKKYAYDNLNSFNMFIMIMIYSIGITMTYYGVLS